MTLIASGKLPVCQPCNFIFMVRVIPFRMLHLKCSHSMAQLQAMAKKLEWTCKQRLHHNHHALSKPCHKIRASPCQHRSLTWVCAEERNSNNRSNNLSFGMLRYASVFLDMQDMLSCAKLYMIYVPKCAKLISSHDAATGQLERVHSSAWTCCRRHPMCAKPAEAFPQVETHWKKKEKLQYGKLH